MNKEEGHKPVHHGHLGIPAGGELLLVPGQEADAREKKGVGKVDADVQEACRICHDAVGNCHDAQLILSRVSPIACPMVESTEPSS